MERMNDRAKKLVENLPTMTAREYIDESCSLIADLLECAADLLERAERQESEIATLQSLVPHPGDGSCDRCGAVPTTAIPSNLCETCREAQSWRKDPPDDQGYWWWWDEDAPPIPVNIFVSGHSNGRYFATTGQHGWNRAQWVEDMGGFWMRLSEPKLPESV